MQKENIVLSSLNTLHNDGKEIIFIAVNRETPANSTNVKGKVESLKQYGVQMPLMLIPAGFAAEEGLELVDNNLTPVTDAQRISNAFVILDGNNRYKAYKEIQKQQKEAVAKGRAYDAGKGLDDIVCFIQTEKPEKGVLNTLIEVNTTAISWKGGDYIRTAAKLNPEDAAINWANEMSKAKMSLSTISLFLTFDSKLKPQTVADFIKGGKLGCKCNVERAKRIYETFIAAGFKQKDINKRYLIKFVISQGEDLGIALEAFKALTEGEVQYISENLKDTGNPFEAVEARIEQLKAQKG
ncbi:MAG: hypothetical protein HDS68_07770 [Bacteroidales bacterium]|nr:hypothetical protein [Bacteroidales bacterium]